MKVEEKSFGAQVVTVSLLAGLTSLTVSSFEALLKTYFIDLGKNILLLKCDFAGYMNK